MPSFKDFLTGVKLPSEFQQLFFVSYVRAFGAVLDSLTQELKAGVKSRFPSHAAADAAEAIGEERLMVRGPGETLAQYVERLRSAWSIWPMAGQPYGVLRALKAAGYPTAKLVIVNQVQYHLDAEDNLVRTPLHPGSYSTRLDRAFWSEFDVIIDAPFPERWPLVQVPRVTVPAAQSSRISDWSATVTAVGEGNYPRDFALRIASAPQFATVPLVLPRSQFSFSTDWDITVTAVNPGNTMQDFAVLIDTLSPGGGLPATFKVSLNGGQSWSTASYDIEVGTFGFTVDSLAGLAADFPGLVPSNIAFSFHAESLPYLNDRIHLLLAPDTFEPVLGHVGTSGGIVVLEGKQPLTNLYVLLTVHYTTGGLKPGEAGLTVSAYLSNGADAFETAAVPFTAQRIHIDDMPLAVGSAPRFTTGLSFWGAHTFDGVTEAEFELGPPLVPPVLTAPATYQVSLNGGQSWSAHPLPLPAPSAVVKLDSQPWLAADFPGKLPGGISFFLTYTAPLVTARVGDRIHVLLTPGAPTAPIATGVSAHGGAIALEGRPLLPALSVELHCTTTGILTMGAVGDGALLVYASVTAGAATFTTAAVPFTAQRLHIDDMPLAVGSAPRFATGLSFWGAGGFVAGDSLTASVDDSAPIATSTAYAIPADDSIEAGLLRYLVRTWAAGHASFNRVVIREAGQLMDYPNATCAEAEAAGVTWDESKVHFWTGTK